MFPWLLPRASAPDHSPSTVVICIHISEAVIRYRSSIRWLAISPRREERSVRDRCFRLRLISDRSGMEEGYHRIQTPCDRSLPRRWVSKPRRNSIRDIQGREPSGSMNHPPLPRPMLWCVWGGATETGCVTWMSRRVGNPLIRMFL